MAHYRSNVCQAATWRVVAELMRRHHRRHDLRVYELHPGGGQYDCIALFAGSLGRELCQLNVRSQHLHVFATGRGPEAVHLPGVRDSDYVAALLGGDDPTQVIDAVERALGLEAVRGPLPPETPAVVVVRVMAAFFARQVFSRERFEARCGWLDSTEVATAREWCARAPAVRAGLAALAGDAPWQERARLAARLWRVQRCDGDRGVVMDLATGAAFGVEATAPASWWTRFRENPRIGPLAEWLAEQLGV